MLIYGMNEEEWLERELKPLALKGFKVELQTTETGEVKHAILLDGYYYPEKRKILEEWDSSEEPDPSDLASEDYNIFTALGIWKTFYVDCKGKYSAERQEDETKNA